MRILLLLLSILPLHLVWIRGVAQNADSLQKALENYRSSDSVRVNLLLQLAEAIHNDSASASALQEAISLASRLKLPRKLVAAHLLMAVDYLTAGNDSAAEKHVSEAMKIAVAEKDKEGEAKSYRAWGRIFQARAKYYEAINYYQKALEIFRANRNSLSTGTVLLDIGVNYYYLTDYVSANDYYLKAMEEFEKAGNKSRVLLTKSNIAMILRVQGKYQSAISYLNECMGLQRELNDSAGLARSLQGIGVAYDMQQKSDSAIGFFEQSLRINRAMGLKNAMGENLTSLGISYKDLNRYNESFSYLTEGINIFKQLNAWSNVHRAELNLAELYNNAPDSFFTSQKIPLATRYQKAATMLNEAIAFARESEETNIEQVALQALSETYRKQGDFRRALEALEKAMLLKDSIFNEEKSESTTLLNAKSAFDKKEALTAAAHNAALREQKIINYALTASGLLVTLGGIFVFIFYKRKKDARIKQQEAELKSEITEVEMKALRAQMNPHFIFNSLNSIGDYIMKNNIAEADTYLAKFAKLMRLILENSEWKEVPLRDDLKALELYMQLESMRLKNKFNHTVSVDPAIDIANTMVPPLLLQPFVENSIWHGIANKPGNGTIRVSISRENDNLLCAVEDDGIGRKDPKDNTPAVNEKKSLGMKITSSRIQLLNRARNANATLHIIDQQPGTRVELRIPIELHT